jgi:hypothetical protein
VPTDRLGGPWLASLRRTDDVLSDGVAQAAADYCGHQAKRVKAVQTLSAAEQTYARFAYGGPLCQDLACVSLSIKRGLTQRLSLMITRTQLTNSSGLLLLAPCEWDAGGDACAK